jgi:hypothetical protein
VPQKPQRPFVPHRTPKTTSPRMSVSEFRLYRPFFPGAHRDRFESTSSISAPSVVEAQSEAPAPIRSIEEFLDTSARVAATAYAQERSESAYAPDSGDRPEQLPPVEHFLDPLPVVEHFAPDAEGALSDAWPGTSGEVGAAESHAAELQESGWLETDWQDYDWRAAAALGEGPEADASKAWATTDWDGTALPARDSRKTAADAIATALDQIAQRIREGELAVPGSAAISDPSKIAATLAALLGVRR